MIAWNADNSGLERVSCTIAYFFFYSGPVVRDVSLQSFMNYFFKVIAENWELNN